MKAVVMSIKDDRAAILAKDGIYYNIPNRDYEIGQLIEYDRKNEKKIIRFARSRFVKFTAAAAAAVLIFVGGYGANTYAYSTVTLDLNPSLKYDLNFFDRVIDFEAYNEDGEDIVTSISSMVLGQDIDSAIETTLDALDEAEYIKEETPVVMTVDSHFFRNERLEKRTQGRMDAWNREMAERNDHKSINGEAVIVTKDLRTRAHDQKMSPGRMIMMERDPYRENEGMTPGEPQGVGDGSMTEPPGAPQAPAVPFDNEGGDIAAPPGAVQDEEGRNAQRPPGVPADREGGNAQQPPGVPPGVGDGSVTEPPGAPPGVGDGNMTEPPGVPPGVGDANMIEPPGVPADREGGNAPEPPGAPPGVGDGSMTEPPPGPPMQEKAGGSI
ncbi:MAG: hypothetical protein K5770_02355 [Lachnospiraceae bacterium]|nr:hypothetical protein [Lachnospiraceae bacterium]